MDIIVIGNCNTQICSMSQMPGIKIKSLLMRPSAHLCQQALKHVQAIMALDAAFRVCQLQSMVHVATCKVMNRYGAGSQ